MTVLSQGLMIVSILALFVACDHTKSERDAQKLVHEIQMLLPAVTGRADASVNDYAARYSSFSQGPQLSGSDIYLFPDGSYMYVRYADLLPPTIHDKGRWGFAEGILTLESDASIPESARTHDVRYVALVHEDDLFMLGAEKEYSYFITNGLENPSLLLEIISHKRAAPLSIVDTDRLKRELMQQAWTPDFFQ